tara:strand:+ start:80 stop:367 length:288 start_codon:yes stop_codon:yes gene_type:complete
MSAPSRTYFEKAVADYLEAYEDYDQDTIHEYVDGIVPITYHGIWQKFDSMNLIITEAHVGLEIWKVMRAEVYDAYYEIFVEILDEALEELEQEDD